jgi:catechol 2,3-dioxygenase-like lactoylglutathione lyase family enzyme
MRQTGKSYTVALAAERRTRPPPRKRASTEGDSREKEVEMSAKPVAATRLRGIWMGVTSFDRSRAFYERLGAYFDAAEPVDGIVSATLGGTRLIFEAGHGNPSGAGPFLLFDVTDADALHAELHAEGFTIEGPPRDEPWGRQFNVRDPDGHSIAFLGPIP